jgi:hypothetical protein
MLLIGYCYAHAQNTGANPYLDSEHSYRVQIGDTNTDQVWIITNGTTSYTLFSEREVVTTPVWATILGTGSGAGNAGIGYHGVRILFDNSAFSTGTWYLRYFEYLNHPSAALECVAAREYEITISANSFYLTVSHNETDRLGDAGLQIYNSQHNKVRSITDLEGVTDSLTTVNYTVTMNKSGDFDPSYWQFNANFADAVHSINAVVTTPDGGSVTSLITNTPGTDYTLVVTPTATNPDLVTVQLTVTYAHNMLVDVLRDFQLTNGVAVVQNPPAPDIVANDNIQTYPIGDIGNRTQAVTILAIPSTRDITFDNSINSNETASTAQNPLQNSTHYYMVEMGNIANTGIWHLEDNTGTTVLTEGSGITPSISGTDDLATVNYGTLTPGAYTLYYTETDATRGTITIREYPISLQPPFDVVLAATGDQCAEASGEVYANLQSTQTQIVYNISLPDNDPDPVGESYYSQAWSFNIALASNPDFLAGNLELTAITTTNPSGVSLSGSGASRAVSVDAGTTSVNIQVTYNGQYIDEHDITVTISSITGTFNEVAADKADAHLIYAMPQTGTLAGVD